MRCQGLKRTKTTLPVLQAVLAALLLAILTTGSAFAAAEDPARKGPAAGGAGATAAAAGGRTEAAGAGAGSARPAGQLTGPDEDGELIGGAYAKPVAGSGNQGAGTAAAKPVGAAGGGAAGGTAKTASQAEDADDEDEPGADSSYDGPEIVVRSSEEVRQLAIGLPTCMLACLLCLLDSPGEGTRCSATGCLPGAAPITSLTRSLLCRLRHLQAEKAVQEGVQAQRVGKRKKVVSQLVAQAKPVELPFGGGDIPINGQCCAPSSPPCLRVGGLPARLLPVSRVRCRLAMCVGWPCSACAGQQPASTAALSVCVSCFDPSCLPGCLPAAAGPCKAGIQKYCRKVVPGAGGVAACLFEQKLVGRPRGMVLYRQQEEQALGFPAPKAAVSADAHWGTPAC